MSDIHSKMGLQAIVQYATRRAVGAPEPARLLLNREVEIFQAISQLRTHRQAQGFGLSRDRQSFDTLRHVLKPIETETGSAIVSPIAFSEETFHSVKCDEFVLEIDSIGGDVSWALGEGLKLRQKHPRLVAKITNAFSAACLLAQLAHHRMMSRNGMMMLHPPTIAALGTVEELRSATKTLVETKTVCSTVLMWRTGRDAATVKDWLSADHWFTAEEALTANLVDELF